MKNPFLVFAGMVLMVLTTVTSVNAQDEEKKSNFSVGTDFYTSYIWRGTKYGQGPSLQPCVKFEKSGLTLGVWGSFDASGYSETDPYISYATPFGLSLGFTDYYYPELPLFEVSKSDTTGSHALELNAGYSKGGFSLSANYILNKAGGAGSAGGDMYFQAGYSFSNVSLFVGAGNGWYTSDGEFALCNLGIGATKEIQLTEKFSVPVNGQVIMNPEREQLYVVVGFSF
jgi:hypothetical protein